jgi:hypothetical protein
MGIDRTAGAVLRYKTERSIINFAYQRKPDEIVGKMTTRSLDDAVIALEAEYGATLMGVLAYLDTLLMRHGLTLTPTMQPCINRIRAHAACLARTGALRSHSGRFVQAYREGVSLMEYAANDYRAPIVFAAAPLAAGAGAAVLTFLIVIGALIALLLISELLIDGGKLGSRVNEAIQEVIDAGEAAIVDNFNLVNKMTDAIDRCKARSQNRSDECDDALERHKNKRRDTSNKRNELQKIIQQLKNATGGSPKKLIWKLLVKQAQKIAEELADLEKELKKIWHEINNKCGCRFINVL